MSNKQTLASVVLILVVQIFSPSAFSQGSLTPPPGTPVPTFKTLQQVEPRTDLQNAAASAVDTSDTDVHFVINQPGSYYLSDNLSVSKAVGIRIAVEGVTLDLRGFEIARSGTGGTGITILTAAHRAEISNGSVKGFTFGINAGEARGCSYRRLGVSKCTIIAVSVGPGAVVENCRLHDNTGTQGLAASTGATLVNCTAVNNTVSTAISAGAGSTLTGCVAANNTTARAILADAGSTITNCSASSNTSSASMSAGITLFNGGTITNCVSKSNGSTAVNITSDTGMGYEVGSESVIENSVASGNAGDGIYLAGSASARNNNSTFNGAASDAAGIHVVGSNCRVEGNNVTSNDRGIDVDSTGNLIIKNSARSNGTNYAIVANNVVGPVVAGPSSAAIDGNTGGSGVGSTDPWANISY